VVLNFEQTSDGFRLRDLTETIKPTKIPLTLIKRVDLLREKGYLPPPPVFTIVNNHHELAFDLKTSLPLEKIVDLLGEIQTLEGQKLKKDPPMETIDFYLVKPKELITLRLRLYFQNEKILSCRVIISDLSLGKKIFWLVGAEKIPARIESVYIIRKDLIGKNQTAVNSLVKEFLTTHKFISVLVYKRVVKGNFGIEKMWDHRKAIYKNQKREEINATARKHILGMGSYLTVAFQNFRLKKLARPINSAEVSPLAKKLINASLSPGNCFRLLTNSPPPLKTRIEFESKNNDSEAVHLINQALMILKKEKIIFSTTSRRKVNCNNQK
jgi:hypothetical protein